MWCVLLGLLSALWDTLWVAAFLIGVLYLVALCARG
jgi:hypothetical protein